MKQASVAWFSNVQTHNQKKKKQHVVLTLKVKIIVQMHLYQQIFPSTGLWVGALVSSQYIQPLGTKCDDKLVLQC